MKVEIKSKVYHNQNHIVEVLKDIDVSFEHHGMYVIVADRSVGKTTLLDIIAQEDNDFEGCLDIDGSISYVKQKLNCWKV